MSRGFLIRPADPADAAALVKLGRDVGSEPGGWLITTSDWRSESEERRYLRALRRYPNAAVFVAESSGEVVARLSLARDQHPASSHVADLGMMVAKPHRRRGIGWALLEQAVQWAREQDVQKIELHVFPHNEAAMALYERFGFEREGFRKAHYRRSNGQFVDAILMAYTVGPD